LAVHHWLRRPDEPGAVEGAAAWNAWQPLRERIAAMGRSTAEVKELVECGARHINRTLEQVSTFPTTLCHGDCHLGNLLRDAENGLVWSDWQEVGIGHGPGDLSFLIQRAMVDGGRVPEDAMIAAYGAQLADATGTSIPLAALRQVTDSFDLRTRLLLWPAYLAMAPDAGIDAHIARVGELLARS
jgi:thiamine kinase-like enzyme